MTQVRVVRASDFIGTDVTSSDAHKVGDIVDYVFDTARAPRLAYVIVMTGGFLEVGGKIRAVPAAAMTVTGDTAHLRISRDRYLAVEKLPGDRLQYLSNPENAARLAQWFHVAAERPNPSLVSYSMLARREAFTANETRVGYIDDVWISFDRDRAPFVEITPALHPLEVPEPERYAVPMAKMESPGHYVDGYTFNVSMDELLKARPVEETPGVAMVNDGFIGNMVLRVTVPAIASGQATPAQFGGGAGGPTGLGSTQQDRGSAAAATEAAQRIRRALDRDAVLGHADVRVVPQKDQVLLEGTVASDALRDRAEETAMNEAAGVKVDCRIRVQNQ